MGSYCYHTLMLMLALTNLAVLTEAAPITSETEEDHKVILKKSWFDYSHKDNQGESEKPMEDDSLFEGDLRIPYEIYKENYIDTDTEENGAAASHMKKRGAIKNRKRLWPNGKVYYKFNSRVDRSTKDLIRESMDHIEDVTCLRFVTDKDESSKITFQTHDAGCYSNSIGRQQTNVFSEGQKINLNGNDGCINKPLMLHEIGHGIGFWHEQSRPDRDSYVEILWNNIQSGKDSQFQKRSYQEVNHYGSVYDYGSVMHYPKDAFNKDNCRNCDTIRVKNTNEYAKQGRPTLGPKDRLSKGDIEQIKAMYSCSDRGIKGQLKLKIKKGVKLPDTDTSFFSGKPESYVKVTAVHTEGTVVRQTKIKTGTSITWDQELGFGEKEWTFFRIQVRDEDWLTDDDEMTLSETIPLERLGSRTSQKHCLEPERCDGYVTYDYSLL